MCLTKLAAGRNTPSMVNSGQLKIPVLIILIVFSVNFYTSKKYTKEKISNRRKVLSRSIGSGEALSKY